MRITPDDLKSTWERLTWPHRIALVLIVALAIVATVYVLQRASDRWKTNVVDRKDAKLEKQVDKDLQSAEVHGTNADAAAVRRKDLEAAYAVERDRLIELRKETARQAERLNDARKQHEQILRSTPADYDPILSDADLCAELQRLDPPIPCR